MSAGEDNRTCSEGPTCADPGFTPTAAPDGRRSLEETSALSQFVEIVAEMDFVHVLTCVLVPAAKYHQPVDQNQFSSAALGA